MVMLHTKKFQFRISKGTPRISKKKEKWMEFTSEKDIQPALLAEIIAQEYGAETNDVITIKGEGEYRIRVVDEPLYFANKLERRKKKT